MSRSLWPRFLAVAVGLVLSGGAVARAAPSIDDYKYFRALSIDLQGRIPTRAELAEFERPDFKVDAWIDQRLQGPGYAERLTRVYADLMHIQLRQFQYDNSRSGLYRIQILDPQGQASWIYFRPGQKRVRDAKNGGLCLTEAESGLKFNGNQVTGVASPVTKGVLDLYTTTVKPWWLYADYAAKSPPGPTGRYGAGWGARFPGFVTAPSLLKEPDNKTDTYEIRVCKEEASVAESAPRDGKPELVSCLTGYGAGVSSGCGCGVGLERCLPGSGQQSVPLAYGSSNLLLGLGSPTDVTGLGHNDWFGLWMYEEPIVFMNRLFGDDRDFRELLTGRYTYVNGPLAQFYRFAARSNWRDYSFDYYEPPPLTEPQAMPADLAPMDVGNWRRVEDRGANAAGLLTMPVFLQKYATRRARAHAAYNIFLCRDFIAPQGLQLSVTVQPNLMKRDGCAACHQTLEPLSAYFARIVESDWNWLDPKVYPTVNPNCRDPKVPGPAMSGACASRYDPAFATANSSLLRGAYGSPEHADAGPQGLAQDFVKRPDFPRCVAQNIATSFLGRELRADDAALHQKLAETLSGGGYKVRAMVRLLLQSDAYRSANNLSSSAWRNGGGK